MMDTGVKNPNDEWRFRLRTLNEAAMCLPITKMNAFRPTHTIWPSFDDTSRKNALYLADYVLNHQQEFLVTINAHCLIALVSTDVAPYKKGHIVNLTIKWLLRNQIEVHMLHHILQSIHAPYLTLRRLGRVRLGIYIYLTTRELINFYDIDYEQSGSISIRRKSGIPNDSAHYDDFALIRFCKSINQVTDCYYNPFWPEGTFRKDPEAPVFRRGKVHVPAIAIPMKPDDLNNQCFKWDFETRGTPFTGFREPVAHSPAVDWPSLLPHNQLVLLNQYRPQEPKKTTKDIITNTKLFKEKPGSGFDLSPLPKKCQPLSEFYGNSKTIKWRSMSTTTTSGYGSTSFQSDSVGTRFEEDLQTDFENKCSVSGSRPASSSPSNTKGQTTHQNITWSHRAAGKIPVKTRPGGCSQVFANRPRNNWNNRGNRNYHRHFNDQKNFPDENSAPHGQHSAPKKTYPAQKKKPFSPSGPSERIKKEAISDAEPTESLTPPPKFVYDPVRNIIQQNY